MQLSIFTVLDPTKIASTSDLNMSEYVSDIELVIFVLLFFSKVIYNYPRSLLALKLCLVFFFVYLKNNRGKDFF